MQLKDIINIDEINKKICEKMLEKLNEKYNEEFEINTFGQRIGNGTCDTASFVCSPKENKKIVFDSMIKTNFIDFDDNYSQRKECSKIEEDIKDIFSNNNIKIINRVELEDNEIFADIFISGTISDDQINTIFNSINQKYKANDLYFFIYEIKDEEFESYKEKSKFMTDLKSIGLNNKDLLKKYIVKIISNEIRIVK